MLHSSWKRNFVDYFSTWLPIAGWVVLSHLWYLWSFIIQQQMGSLWRYHCLVESTGYSSDSEPDLQEVNSTGEPEKHNILDPWLEHNRTQSGWCIPVDFKGHSFKKKTPLFIYLFTPLYILIYSTNPGNQLCVEHDSSKTCSESNRWVLGESGNAWVQEGLFLIPFLFALVTDIFTDQVRQNRSVHGLWYLWMTLWSAVRVGR